jgi:thiol:disulfide interchange protein DsbC
MKKVFLTSAIAIALTSTAAQATPEAVQAVSKVFQLDSTQLKSMKSPMEGWSVVMPKEAPDQYLLTRDDGRYVLYKDQILDVEARDSIQSQIDMQISDLMKDDRKAMMAAVEGKGIVFTPKGNIQARISVFTEPSCPYCQRLHENLDALTDAGIEVTYYIFPRSGMGASITDTFIKMWADPEQRKARFESAYENPRGWEAFEDLKVSDEDKQVATDEMALMMQTAVNIGLQGTPYAISEDGRVLPGYRDPQAIIDWAYQR